MDEITFDGRVAVVTGAGNGLGRSYALELGRRGAAVVVNDIGGTENGKGGDEASAQQVVNEIRLAGGIAVPSYDSVSTPEGGEAIIKTGVDSFGRVDIVINNAGILRDKSFAKLDWGDLEAVLDVHLKGAFYVSRPAFLSMRERGYGRFVFTSSASGIWGNFGQSNYGAAKLGIVGLSNVLSAEGAKQGILSNCIAPAARTRMTEHLLGEAAEALDPELVTPMTVFLASEACTFTHRVFSAAGGKYARIFTGLTPGWYAGRGVRPSVEDIHTHLSTIESETGYTIPLRNEDELQALYSTLTT